ncbi:hypothetical protein JOF29_000324 [Kribbella aluminosa]|uniref:Uncharacterized protein n=1 Tax=Kribbella aluminosa TaxID=416017 RepID=A0ABS4UCA8_9ACTN|nr:hypothetical protein [Kribbella aluminosa]MBP2349241.1 hypothetical protein [Kribbella aluminosa]
MTAQQHHDVQHETPADEQYAAPDRTDPLGPIALPKRHQVGARALALVGVVGMSTMAVAVAAPSGLPWVTH